MGKFIIKKTATGYGFTLKATNGETIAASEVYETEAACRRGIASVEKISAKARLEDTTEPSGTVTNPKFQIYTDRAGQFRFRLRSRNGQIVAVSAGYHSKTACLAGVESVRLNAPGSEAGWE